MLTARMWSLSISFSQEKSGRKTPLPPGSHMLGPVKLACAATAGGMGWVTTAANAKTPKTLLREPAKRPWAYHPPMTGTSGGASASLKGDIQGQRKACSHAPAYIVPLHVRGCSKPPLVELSVVPSIAAVVDRG